MTAYEKLELLEREAVQYLKDHPGPQRNRSAELLARILNQLAARWGCHYTVSATHLRTRTGNDPYGYGSP